MWFASLWIFTLKLPWQLGADFFLRHLLDGDPASNTLSWRWVAGLQTRGKTYLARAENISRYTSRRIQPIEAFAEEAQAIDGPTPPRAKVLPQVEPIAEERFGLLLTEEDLDPMSLPIDFARVSAVAGFVETARRSPWPVGELAIDFTSRAMDEALQRSSTAPRRLDGGASHEHLLDWANSHDFKQVVTPYAPQGPAREWLDEVKPTLETSGIRLTMLRRAWDDRLWPFATSGFFDFKKSIPGCLKELGIGR
jgi:hypothetical protein